MNQKLKFQNILCLVSYFKRSLSLSIVNLNIPRSECINTSTKTSNSRIEAEVQFISSKPSFSIELLPYYIENGLRKVYPYYYEHSTFCKGRWIKKNLIDCYIKEFALYPREEYERRVLNGRLKVNGKMVGLDYVLQSSDLITSNTHRHELAVLATSINIIYEDRDLLVVDKPPSLPVHTCALYRYNTVSRILDLEHKQRNLHEIHRLDRLTSGVLIYAKSSEKSREMHDSMKHGNIKKEYVCRVEGNFPDGVVVCNKPIKQIYNKVGINLVNPFGKMCITEFQKMSFNGKSSVVLCKPYTGRTHQIRVHLQYLGHPIVNDPLYNSYVFGEEKGKNGILNKSIEQLMEDLIVEHSTQWWLEDTPEKPSLCGDHDKELMDVVTKTYTSPSKEYFSSEKYQKDSSRFTHDKDCYFCRTKFRDPKQKHLLMLLHAHKYESNEFTFQTEMPVWASEDWCIS